MNDQLEGRYNYRVTLYYQTFYLRADDYSVSGGRYLFWVGQKVVRSFLIEDVERVDIVG